MTDEYKAAIDADTMDIINDGLSDTEDDKGDPDETPDDTHESPDDEQPEEPPAVAAKDGESQIPFRVLQEEREKR